MLQSLPLTDWQFYVTTVATVGAAWLVVRPFLALRAKPGQPCPGCGNGACQKKAPELVSLPRRS